MTNKEFTPQEAIEIILSAQLCIDDNNQCQAESLLAVLVGKLNESAKVTRFNDKKLQEVFEYYTELNDIQDEWMKKNGTN